MSGAPSRALRMLAGAALAVAVAGCAANDRSVALVDSAVVPMSVGESGSVTAIELAEVMLRAGFAPEEILRHGPDVRNALATSGGAQVRSGATVQALFAIHDNRLYVTSRTAGTFSKTLGAVSPGQAPYPEGTT